MKKYIESFWQGDHLVSTEKNIHIQVEIELSDLESSAILNVGTSFLTGGEFDPETNVLSINSPAVENRWGKTIDPREDNNVIHEVGHALGLRDMRWNVPVDLEQCTIRRMATIDDIMDDPSYFQVESKIQPYQLKFLYETYATDNGQKLRDMLSVFYNGLKE